MRDKKIGVLMGGVSRERDVSLRSGAKVLDSLKRQGFDASPIDPIENDKLISKLQEIDIAFIALHGQYGEDGAIQGLLEILQIPYTGSGVLSSALAMNKIASKQIFQACGIPTPQFWTFEYNGKDGISEKCKEIVKQTIFPVIAKPTSQGSSLGITIIKEPNMLEETIKTIIKEYGSGFVEGFIEGKSVTVGILGVGEGLRSLPVLELVSKNEFYDYEAKYTNGMTEFIVPAQLNENVYLRVQQVALQTHSVLGCHGVSRVDMMVDSKGIPYVHDVNTIPGLTDVSDLPAEAIACGIGYDELILEILNSALNRCSMQ